MSLSRRLAAYLDERGVSYETLPHHPSHSSLGSAIAAQVPTHKLAKAVMLENEQGHRLMAVIPADSKLSLSVINDTLGSRYHLMKEKQVYDCFDDCEHGAVPPLANAYNMDCIVDDALVEQADVYLEGGDHRSLVHLSQEAFMRLMEETRHARISKRIYH